MKQLVNWERYSSLYSKVKQEDFLQAEALAEKEVRDVIGIGRWNTIEIQPIVYQNFYMDTLQDCICKVMDKMADQKAIGVGKGIASVSNDGYSENYVVQTEAQAKEDMQICIRAWLSGTGLVGAY